MRRPIISLILAGLVAGLVAAPASAATVRVVDNDGKGSPASCDSSASAFKKVQAAVNASSAGDTILVCPGTYDEQITIGAAKDGLKIRGVGHWTATIRPTSPTPGSDIIRIKPGADRVSISELRLRYKAPLGPVAGPACAFLDAAISVQGEDARIRSNSIVATGDGRLSCGLLVGIQVGSPPVDSAGASVPSAAVRYNVVKDFMQAGIAAFGPGTEVTAFRNIIQFHQRGVSLFPVRKAGRLTPAGNRGGGRGFGIAVLLGATGIIRENTVEASRPGRGPLSNGLDAIYLGQGIAVDSTTASEVRANRVYRAAANIATMGGLSPAQTVAGPTIAENTALSGLTGILVQGSNAVIENNQAQANSTGLYAGQGSSQNLFSGNEARANLGVDCVDDTGQDAGSVANVWTGNLANTDSPAGICVIQNP